jgi:hypothetical protein
MSNEVSARTLLLRLGVSDFNATMMIPYMFTSPMTTDPKSPMIILLVKHLQKKLNTMGAGLIVTGYLDRPTAAALSGLLGGNQWSSWAWSDVIAATIKSHARDIKLTEVAPITPYAIPATGDMPLGLPEVPGGIFTYAAGAAALWYFMKKRSARA